MKQVQVVQCLRMGERAVTAACVVVVLACGGCGSVAGNAAVAALGAGATVSLLTHSHVDVSVETFQDTLLCPKDQTQFQLPQGTVLVQQAMARVDPAQNPTPDNMIRAESSFALKIGGLDAELSRLRVAATPSKPPPVPVSDLDKASDAVWKARASVMDAIKASESTYDAFTKAVAAGTHSGATEDETLAMLRNYGMLTVSFTQIRCANERLRAGWELYKAAAKNKLKTAATAALSSNSGTTRRSAMDAAQVVDLTQGIENANASEADITPIDALATPTFQYDGLLSDTNFGPLINEAMQEVMSRSGAIDLMLKPDNAGYWKTFQSASACAGPGDQNAVIYLENVGTPILKTGSFDPSQFIAAFGNLYRVALTSLATAVSTPAPSSAAGISGKTPSATAPPSKATTTSQSNSPTGTGSSNGAIGGSRSNTTTVLTAQSDTAAADAASAQAKVEMLAAFKVVLDAEAPFGKPGSSPTAADARAAAVALTNAAATLGNPTPSK